MGLLDGYFDPQQFADGGGLLGRLLSLQRQQDQYQPGAGFDPQIPADGQTPSVSQTPLAPPIALPTWPSVAWAPTAPQTPDLGQTQNIAIGNYQMPQFGRADGSQAAPPSLDLGDRVSASLQSWAHTPVGNPFAAIANGITGFNAGQRGDAAGAVPAQTPSLSSAPLSELDDRLSAGFQSWTHTRVGNPFAALANGIAGLNSGRRTDPTGIAQQNLQSGTAESANAQGDLNVRYQALRPVLGDRNAMLAIVHPETGQALIAQALAGQTRVGNTGDAGPSGNGQAGAGAGLGDEKSSTAGGQPPGLSKVGYIETPANSNHVLGELLGIQDSRRKDAVGSDDYLSGVREGNVRRNPEDGSLDVTNGTVVTLSLKDGRAKTVTVTNTDIAHIDGTTGEVVIKKSPLRNGI